MPSNKPGRWQEQNTPWAKFRKWLKRLIARWGAETDARIHAENISYKNYADSVENSVQLELDLCGIERVDSDNNAAEEIATRFRMLKIELRDLRNKVAEYERKQKEATRKG